MPKFTAENAAEMAKRSHVAGSARFMPKPEPDPVREMPQTLPQNAAEPAEFIDRFSADLTCACDEMLGRVRKAKKPIEAAQLARALRDLRETWHLATGKARPGLTRPQDARAMPRREVPRMVANGVAMNSPNP